MLNVHTHTSVVLASKNPVFIWFYCVHHEQHLKPKPTLFRSVSVTFHGWQEFDLIVSPLVD